MKIDDDLVTELANGVYLINLLEILSGKSFHNYTPKPATRFHRLQNNDLVLKFLKSQGVKLVGICAEDIVEANTILILAVMWAIIVKYHICPTEGSTPRNELLKWVKNKIPQYNITSFSKGWEDGRAMCVFAYERQSMMNRNHFTFEPL